jgi:putative transposase
MPRLARVVVPGYPHHVTQRGNRRMRVFFSDDDHRAYLDLLADACARAGTEVWAWCLMPNHVHLIMVPSHADGLRAGLGEAHRRYTRRINFREAWRGHLWQERFHSFPMDEDYLLACARYVELNPVRAGLTRRPDEWPWSSARAHLAGADDGLAKAAPLLDRVGDWRAFLDGGLPDEALDALRGHARTGRPLGSAGFVEALERITGRALKKRKPGPRGRDAGAGE